MHVFFCMPNHFWNCLKLISRIINFFNIKLMDWKDSNNCHKFQSNKNLFTTSRKTRQEILKKCTNMWRGKFGLNIKCNKYFSGKIKFFKRNKWTIKNSSSRENFHSIKKYQNSGKQFFWDYGTKNLRHGL